MVSGTNPTNIEHAEAELGQAQLKLRLRLKLEDFDK